MAKDSEYRNPNTRRRRFREVELPDEDEDNPLDGDYGIYELTPDAPGDGRIIRKKVE